MFPDKDTTAKAALGGALHENFILFYLLREFYFTFVRVKKNDTGNGLHSPDSESDASQLAAGGVEASVLGSRGN